MTEIWINYAVTEKKSYSYAIFGRPEERGYTYLFSSIILMPRQDGQGMQAMPFDAWEENANGFIEAATQRAARFMDVPIDELDARYCQIVNVV